MRTLSEEQARALSHHITTKPIDYIELYNELYDHYASSYENGDLSWEETITRLDEQFDYNKVKLINDRLFEKTNKLVLKSYWSEMKNFWRWPQLVSSLAILAICFLFMELFGIKMMIYAIFLPLIGFGLAIMLYGLWMGYKKKVSNRRLKSAHLMAASSIMHWPLIFFNLSTFLPILFMQQDYSRIAFFENFPFIFIVLFLFSLSTIYISFKVFRSKIQMQYL